ncbi:YciI family protein [Nonomuraea sp. NPDC049141]|uniref:YciI family protein n=1 Tax=Nonomuraea sp. NPDC049141 TaxID=3155500 RepID=UPI0033EA0CD7
MAQYLISVLDDTTDSATAEEMAATGAFNEQLQAEGHWVFAGGLALPSTATVVDGRDGEAVFSDGPYLESKEYVGGFWIIEALHLDVALRLAALASKDCNRRVELRPFLGALPMSTR